MVASAAIVGAIRMIWFRTTIAVVAFVGLAIHAEAFGPTTGDRCSAWVVCPGGTAASGTYPACDCDTRVPARRQTCEAAISCDPGWMVSGTWPTCSCVEPPPPAPKPPPRCDGPCEIEISHQCFHIKCRVPPPN